MTEGYNAWDYSPFLVRYKLGTMLWPWRLSNLSEKTPIRQLAVSRLAYNLNTGTEAEAEASTEDKSEASTEARSEGQVSDPTAPRPLLRRSLSLRININKVLGLGSWQGPDS